MTDGGGCVGLALRAGERAWSWWDVRCREAVAMGAAVQATRKPLPLATRKRAPVDRAGRATFPKTRGLPLPATPSADGRPETEATVLIDVYVQGPRKGSCMVLCRDFMRMRSSGDSLHFFGSLSPQVVGKGSHVYRRFWIVPSKYLRECGIRNRSRDQALPAPSL